MLRRPTTLAVLGALLLVAGCGGEAAPEDRQETDRQTGDPAGNDRDPRLTAPGDARAVDLTGLVDGDALAAILSHVHGAAGTGFTRCALEWEWQNGWGPLQVIFAAPARMRVRRSDGRTWWVNGKQVMTAETAGEPAVPATAGKSRGRILAMARGLDAAVLGPLWRTSRAGAPATLEAAPPAAGAQAAAPQAAEAQRRQLKVTPPGEGQWTVTIAANGVPVSLAAPPGSGPPETVRILQMLDTGVSMPVTRIAVGQLGEAVLRFSTGGMQFQDAAFTPPTDEPPPAVPGTHEIPGPQGINFSGGPGKTPQLGTPDRPHTPTLQRLDEVWMMVLPDPVGWPKRRQAWVTGFETLYHQHDQMLAGLPELFTEDGDQRLGILFRPDPQYDGKPLAELPGRDIRYRAPCDALVAYRGPGPFEQMALQAAGALQAAAANQGRQPAGPVRILPMADFAAGEPRQDQLSSITVRAELPLKPR